MANMKVGTSPYTPSFEVEKNEFKSQTNYLKGVTPPKGESLEHGMFSRKLENNVCSEVYAVSVKTVIKGIQGATKARQLTGAGEGAGGG